MYREERGKAVACCSFGSTSTQWQNDDRHSPETVTEEVQHHTLVKDLNALSVEEREHVYDEIHGVEDAVEETPEFLAQCLADMRIALEKVPRRKRKSYDHALFLRPSLEWDEKLHLLFLRANRFDVPLSALKLCRHFDHKLELFGESKLVEKITLSDLSEKELRRMSEGGDQFLNQRDRSGRLIRFLNSSRQFPEDWHDWKSAARYMWYQTMAALEDEEVQKKGAVYVLFLTGDVNGMSSHIIQGIMSSRHIQEDWPLRLCCIHICYSNPTLNTVLNFLFMVASKDLRVRFRTHFGSPVEIQYDLMSFGIRLDKCLDPGTDQVSQAFIQNYVEHRKKVEASWKQYELSLESSALKVDYPRAGDVLLGRGRPFREYHGNIRFNQIISSYSTRYAETTERLDKTKVAMDLLNSIKADGGRFLQRVPTGWELVPDKVAREKISQALRLEVAKGKKQNSTGSVDGPMADDESTHSDLSLLSAGVGHTDDVPPGTKRPRFT